MDFFSRLPATIRIQILIDLGSPSCIRRLTKASPTMLQQYIVHRHIIVREVLRELIGLDKTGGLLQNAMALLYLADLDPKRYPRQKRRRLLTYSVGSAPLDKEEADFLHYYDKQTFPNPLENSKRSTQLRIYQLISQIIIRVEDYRLKEDYSETSRHAYPFRKPSLTVGRSWSPHEYKMRLKLGVLPRAEWPVNDSDWPVHQLRQMKNLKNHQDHIRIPFSSLESWERCLFIRAFLKYELFSTLELFFGPHPYHQYFTIHPFRQFLSPQERDAVVLVHWHHQIHWCKILPSASTNNSRPCACLHKLRSVVQIP